MKQDADMHQNVNDTRLAKICASTLDDSLNDIDELSLRRLKNVRVIALAQPKPSRNKWVRYGVAASLMLFIATPIMLGSKYFIASTDVGVLTQESPISEQEMDDIEMLMSLGDVDA